MNNLFLNRNSNANYTDIYNELNKLKSMAPAPVAYRTVFNDIADE